MLIEKTNSWKMFNKIAPTYDRINRILSFGLDRGWRKQVAKYLPEKKPLHILDVATGTGDQLIALFESKAKIQQATGIDLAREMLAIAEKKLSGYRDKIQLIQADAQKIPNADHTFDVVTFSFGIRNVPNPLQSLQEIYRVLKKEGICLILEFSLPPKPIRAGYLFYLRHILPKIGNFLSKQATAYTYLNQTIETFPTGNAFANLLRQAGFKKITIKPFALGSVALYIGKKE
ncbi:MAG TPA: bifunctional demethylmenaquinone methyltransferase/2-methoxy-6-polyprenyl-1,4-benzoquinol methylase UbiE [Chlamydiales bacterium]|nr:bifunctional demethylmenaquinone methyltransferase/2-methoxy-6-polyprenyl-1,4-benzoquinol methylase UbiE [Chlamydiales bacterium]